MWRSMMLLYGGMKRSSQFGVLWVTWYEGQHINWRKRACVIDFERFFPSHICHYFWPNRMCRIAFNCFRRMILVCLSVNIYPLRVCAIDKETPYPGTPWWWWLIHETFLLESGLFCSDPLSSWPTLPWKINSALLRPRMLTKTW